MIKWPDLADDILRKLNAQGRSISSLRQDLQVSRATVWRLANAKPVEVSTYLAVCRWLGCSLYVYYTETPS